VAASERLTVERVFSEPPLTGGLPVEPRFTPDGRGVAFLRTADDDRERMDLWRHDVATGKTTLWISGARLEDTTGDMTDAERAERERRRQFAHGITRFQFSADGRYLLLPAAGTGYVLDLNDDMLRALTPPGTRQTDFRFDPTSRFLSYVRDGDLYVVDLASLADTRITTDGGGTVSNGIADFIAQEEMHRFEGHWWSPDGRYLAYTRVDEAPVAESYRYEIDADAIRVIPQRYPYAGAANAQVRLFVYALETRRTLEIDWAHEIDDYLARVGWWSGRLLVQAQSRDQRRLDLLAFDVVTGTRTGILTESSATWINLHDNCRPVDDGRLLWTSERDGYGHLYLWMDGALRQLTFGAGRVNRILWADTMSALVQGWFGDPTEQHVYRVLLDRPGANAPEAVTTRPGWHDAIASNDGARLLDRSTSLEEPGRIELIDLAGDRGPPIVVAEDRITPAHPYFPYQSSHSTPVLGSLAAEDGQRLYYRLTRPRGIAMPPAGFPVVVHVYGGPGVQRVRNEWPPVLLQLLAQRGFAVLELDNRGTGNRGREFEAPIHGRLGAVEVRDQVRGVAFLRELAWVDTNRVAVFGHSYGGYMALMCLLQAPEVFRAAVAVAPVTDWALYDTHYTERFLGTPADNPDGYRASSVTEHLDGMRGRLLLVHGMADDNVLYTHSTRLYRALQARNRPFEMMAYPGAKHALQERDVSIHRFDLILDFLERST
jgi:dipeptidyl-peptidase-4